jgi:hypothetical protein
MFLNVLIQQMLLGLLGFTGYRMKGSIDELLGAK